MIEDVLRFVIDAGGGISLPRMRERFPTAAPVLRTCLERKLLELRGQCYHATAAGVALVTAPQVAERVKRCPGCGEVKSESEFWKDAQRADGQYAYCIRCCSTRRRLMIEARQAEARATIRAASDRLVRAAERWDAAVAELADAWREVMAVDDVLRLNRKTAGIDYDSGRMEARLVYQRAMFALLVPMADAQFRIDVPFFRDSEMPATLTEYVGTQPWNDYFGADLEPDSSSPCDEEGGAGVSTTSEAPAPTPVRRGRRRAANSA